MVINLHQMETSSNTLKKVIKMIAEGQQQLRVITTINPDSKTQLPHGFTTGEPKAAAQCLRV